MRRLFTALLATVALAGAARADCTVSVGPLAFGTYDVFDPTPLDSVGAVTYSCSGTVAPSMAIDHGGAAGFSPRAMSSGASTLAYNLYTDAARTQVWGDGSAGTSTVACAVGTGLSVPIYGRIFALQNLPVGAYGDSLVVTILF